MNRVLKSLLIAGACAFGLTACATYDYGYSGYTYSEPYYGYGYNSGYYTPYAYDYYGYGPYYGYAPGYYVGPSVGLGFTFRDHDRNDGRDFHRDNHRFRGDRRGSDQDRTRTQFHSRAAWPVRAHAVCRECRNR